MRDSTTGLVESLILPRSTRFGAPEKPGSPCSAGQRLVRNDAVHLLAALRGSGGSGADSLLPLLSPRAAPQAMAGEPFDVVVVGGGITGAGVAFDAATRGYSVALVEKADYASGTS